MNHITENNDPEGALQRCAAECEQEGNTDDHSRYGIGNTADGINTFLHSTGSVLRVVTRAEPYATSVPAAAVPSATIKELR